MDLTEQIAEWSWPNSLIPEALCSPPLNCFQSVTRPSFSKHVPQVIFYSLFGQEKAGRNFFVRQTLADELHNLLFSSCEPKILSYLHTWLPSG